jgi:hypothetical protein
MADKIIRWNEEKNQLLKIQRGVCFEDVLERMERGEILGKKIHPNTEKYPNQQILVIEIEEYIYYVPFVENETEIFLKTIIPSRKLKKEYGGKV